MSNEQYMGHVRRAIKTGLEMLERERAEQARLEARQALAKVELKRSQFAPYIELLGSKIPTWATNFIETENNQPLLILDGRLNDLPVIVENIEGIGLVLTLRLPECTKIALYLEMRGERCVFYQESAILATSSGSIFAPASSADGCLDFYRAVGLASEAYSEQQAKMAAELAAEDIQF